MGSAAQGFGSNPMHTPEWRGRFEELMLRTESGRRRLRARDVQHGLAENLEESRDEDAGGGVGDDREPDERDDDHGQDEDEPNEDQEAEQGRRVKRRVEEARGVRRQRDDVEEDDNDGEPPHVSRRLGIIEKSIADIVRVRNDFARANGMNPNEQCTREVARRMIKGPWRKAFAQAPDV